MYSLIKKLERLPLFSENSAAKLLNTSPKYVRTLLYRLSKRGLIKRIERGKYTCHTDIMIFGTYLTIPSYFSLWTALRYYNATQQQPSSIFVTSPISKKKVTFDSTDIIFVKSKNIFGFKKERYLDFDIFIAEPEKAILDSLLYKLPIDEVVYALNNLELDYEKLTDYASKTKNKALIKRLGFILETVKEKDLGLKIKDTNYTLLDYFGPKKGSKNKKWRIIVNKGL